MSTTWVNNKLVLFVVMTMLAVALVFGGTATADQCIGCGGGKKDKPQHKNHKHHKHHKHHNNPEVQPLPQPLPQPLLEFLPPPPPPPLMT